MKKALVVLIASMFLGGNVYAQGAASGAGAGAATGAAAGAITAGVVAAAVAVAAVAVAASSNNDNPALPPTTTATK